MSIQTGENGRPVNGLSPYKQPTSSDPEPDNNVRSAAVRSRMDFKVTDDLSLTYTAGYLRDGRGDGRPNLAGSGPDIGPAYSPAICGDELAHGKRTTILTRKLDQAGAVAAAALRAGLRNRP